MDSKRRIFTTRIIGTAIATPFVSLAHTVECVADELKTLDPKSILARKIAYTHEYTGDINRCANCVNFLGSSKDDPGQCKALDAEFYYEGLVRPSAKCTYFRAPESMAQAAIDESIEIHDLRRREKIKTDGIPKIDTHDISRALQQYLTLVSGVSDKFYSGVLGIQNGFLYSCDGLECTAVGGVISYKWRAEKIEKCVYDTDSIATCDFRMSMITQSNISGASTDLFNPQLAAAGRAVALTIFSVNLKFQDLYWELAGPVIEK